ncbi:Acetylornithine aminotransferase [Rubripirellula lacrimiformis]|uniref:Acetylornithine aminotransferase n=1 Tax=Rubripirellula lacrimiformis TaxID=1930273 RepID=A0A517N8W9_9BACT|nr:aminotransferase class III-fold pyridoxal phosphate-dependent enzyme [Rubripirellula lacrimiformis]QDT03577.1 Acetylornithine aminotransferase [Rubripirellula lacrimiformis]
MNEHDDPDPMPNFDSEFVEFDDDGSVKPIPHRSVEPAAADDSQQPWRDESPDGEQDDDDEEEQDDDEGDDEEEDEDDSVDADDELPAPASEIPVDSASQSDSANHDSPPLDTAAAYIEPVAPVPPPVRPAYTGDPEGLCRADSEGLLIIDAMAGRTSVFGFGFAPIATAMQLASSVYQGDVFAERYPSPGSVSAQRAGDPQRSDLADALSAIMTTGIQATSTWLLPSADHAIEQAIAIARFRTAGERYRTIAIVGSDHGRTGLCRTASGIPELHDQFGPMMAGFAHAPGGNLAAIESMIDEHTGSVLISPINFAAAASSYEPEFWQGLRKLCDDKDLLLIVDETALVFGAAGTPLTLSSIAEIEADVAVLAAGLFGGLPGGIVIANDRAHPVAVTDTDRYRMIGDVATQTLESIRQSGVIDRIADEARDFAVELAESVSQFEFLRDIHATGMTIGIETDLPSDELVPMGQRHGLRVEAAGDQAIRLQPPLVLADSDRQRLLQSIADMMLDLERSTVAMTS